MATLRSSRKRAPLLSEKSETQKEVVRTVAQNSSTITILWVVVFFFSLGLGLTLLIDGLRLDAVQNAQSSEAQALVQLTQQLNALEDQLAKPSTPPVAAPSTVPSAPTATPSTPTVPAGILTRGTFSPDGKMIAGYDDVTAGKIGIGVQVVGETRIRHIVLFNRYSESSGVGTPYEKTMSVRWTDNQTIEFDVLVKKANGATSVETRTVKIFF